MNMGRGQRRVWDYKVRCNAGVSLCKLVQLGYRYAKRRGGISSIQVSVRGTTGVGNVERKETQAKNLGHLHGSDIMLAPPHISVMTKIAVPYIIDNIGCIAKHSEHRQQSSCYALLNGPWWTTKLFSSMFAWAMTISLQTVHARKTWEAW